MSTGPFIVLAEKAKAIDGQNNGGLPAAQKMRRSEHGGARSMELRRSLRATTIPGAVAFGNAMGQVLRMILSDSPMTSPPTENC